MAQVIKYKNEKWILSISRNMSFFHGCMAVAGYAKDNFLLKMPKKFELYVISNGIFTEAYFRQSDLPEYYKAIEKICSNSKLLNNLKKSYQLLGKSLLRASRDLGKSINLIAYDNFVKYYTFLCAGLSLTSVLGRHIHILLLLKIKKHYPKKTKSEVDQLIGKITYPSEHTPLSESQIELLKIAAYVQKLKIKTNYLIGNKKVNKKIISFLKQYGPIPVNFNGAPWAFEDILKQLKQLLKLDCSEDLRRTQNNHKSRIKEAHDLLSKIPDKTIRNFALALQTGTILNEYRKYVFCHASLAYRPLFARIASRYKLKDWQQMWKLSPDEVRDLYFFKKVEILDKIKARKLVAVVSDQKHGYHILTDAELSSLFLEHKSIVSTAVTATKQVKGSIANSGFVRAKAKIILTAKDFKKFKKGDVLIAMMTSVDFIPLMKQASAFVTDEGGITSHAAIVSREMGKPCIIGTKIATKVFKDGDLVEVDADKGIVKKLTNQEKL